MIAVLIINFRTAAATVGCLDAVLAQLPADGRVFLLDNGSGAADASTLSSFAKAHSGVHFEAGQTNLGFAAGMNRLIELALADDRVDELLLLNNDTLPAADFVIAMRAKLNPAAQVDMVAGTLLDSRDGGVDSLGITLYRSTLASNRKRETEILLGPCGGCALLTRRLLEDLLVQHGEYFDESFFCYAEDTDLVLRSRWLGYETAFAASASAQHAVSLSSGGPDNDFVLYHGIRNSLWWLVKDAPTGWLLRSLPWFVALHAGICLRHLRRGRVRVLWRLYRDALRGLPGILRKRRRIRASRRVSAREFARWVEPHFYERGYLRRAWRELWAGPSA
jgi:GT2 family glycosyltransferase